MPFGLTLIGDLNPCGGPLAPPHEFVYINERGSHLRGQIER